jgi:signal transduction histidine kinase
LPVWDVGLWSQLAYTLNQMAQRLAAAQKERDVFLASVAHELKTPLSVLRGNLEGLSDGVLTPSPERWAALNREINRLTRLVNNFLLIETMRHSPPAWNRQQYDLCEQLAALMLRFEPMGAMKRVTMSMACQVHEVFLDQDRMDQILVNLVDNALRHTPDGGKIRIGLQQKEKPAEKNGRPSSALLEWCIEDSGPGISAQSVPLVLQPFFRDPRSPGAGLGLAVSAALVQAQGDSLAIARSEWGETRICVRLPSP